MNVCVWCRRLSYSSRDEWYSPRHQGQILKFRSPFFVCGSEQLEAPSAAMECMATEDTVRSVLQNLRALFGKLAGSNSLLRRPLARLL